MVMLNVGTIQLPVQIPMRRYNFICWLDVICCQGWKKPRFL